MKACIDNVAQVRAVIMRAITQINAVGCTERTQ